MSAVDRMPELQWSMCMCSSDTVEVVLAHDCTYQPSAATLADVLQVSNTHRYPHMPIGKCDISFIVCMFFVCLFVCMVTDFSAEGKASSIKFCTAVHRRPRPGISHFCELFSPSSPKSAAKLIACGPRAPLQYIALSRIGMCQSPLTLLDLFETEFLYAV